MNRTHGTRLTALPLALTLSLALAACAGDDPEPVATDRPAPTTTSSTGTAAPAPAAPTSAAPTSEAPTSEAPGPETATPQETAREETAPKQTTPDQTGGSAAGAPAGTGAPADGASGVGSTQIRAEAVFGSDGYPTAQWTIQDLTTEGPIGCWATSGSVDDGMGYVCGSSADRGLACLANPLAGDELICITDPVSHQGYRRMLDGTLTDLGPAEQMLPLSVELTDGSLWSLRSGGAANASPDGLVPFYWCQSGCEGDALWGPAGEEAIDSAAPVWTIRRAAENGTEETYEVEIARVWFVAGR